MSIVAFGKMVFSSEKVVSAHSMTSITTGECWLLINSTFFSNTQQAVSEIFENEDGYYRVFEISECAEGTTVEELLMCEIYCEGDGKSVPREPCLIKRLELLKKLLLKVFATLKPTRIDLCISGEGYPRRSDCKEISAKINELDECLYREYTPGFYNIPSVIVKVFP